VDWEGRLGDDRKRLTTGSIAVLSLSVFVLKIYKISVRALQRNHIIARSLIYTNVRYTVMIWRTTSTSRSG
jgi:hypothetical protein